MNTTANSMSDGDPRHPKSVCKTAIIWNPGSGRAAGIAPLRKRFSDDTNRWIELSHHDPLTQEIHTAVNAGCQTIVAAGGDGTVNAVVNALMAIRQSQRPNLGIIPLGTANDFARTLEIPDRVGAAIALLDSGRTTAVDVIRIRAKSSERYFANVAAGGNSVRVTQALTDEIKARWGAFSYLRGAFDVLPDMKSYRVQCQCDEERFEDLNCWAVLVANGRTNAGHIEVAPKASPTDGLLDVILIRDGTVADMVGIAASNLIGHFLDHENVIFRQAKMFRLSTDPKMRFSLDGEVVDYEPIEFEVVPGAIPMHAGTAWQT